MLRKCIRAVLTICLVASIGLAAKDFLSLVQNPTVTFLVERTNEDLSASLTRALNRSSTVDAIEEKLTAQLATVPRNWIVIQSLQEVAETRGFSLNADLKEELNLTYDTDHELSRSAAKCLSCGWDAQNCEFSAVLICRAPVDLTPIGDVSGVLRESKNYVMGDPVDKIDLTLSAVGLGATFVAPITGGTSLSIKLGATAIKTTKKVGNLTPGLARLLRQSADEAIDWEVLARASPDNLTEKIRKSIDLEALRPVALVISATGEIREVQGIPATLHLLRFVENTQDAKSAAHVSRTLGTRTTGAFELVGKSRLLRSTLRYSDEAFGLMLGIGAALASLAGLMVSSLGARTLSSLRRSL